MRHDETTITTVTVATIAAWLNWSLLLVEPKLQIISANQCRCIYVKVVGNRRVVNLEAHLAKANYQVNLKSFNWR